MANDRRYLTAGDRGLLVEVADLDEAIGLYQNLVSTQTGSDPIPGLGELIPAARTVLIGFRPDVISRADLVARLDGIGSGRGADDEANLVEIPVVYDGEDLAEVAELLGTSADEVVELHTGSEYTVAFAGFAPGFAYLVGGHPTLDVPRRSTPRTRIPAGAVGLAGTFSGVYPRESPGGWQLIGQTSLPMWDTDRDPPAALRPGDRVRFVGRDEPEPAPEHHEATTSGEETGRGLSIDAPGVLSLLQDLGRPGYVELGVSASGAMDPVALAQANRLVGNPPGEAGLEILFGGFEATAHGPLVIALAGAPLPVSLQRADGRTVRVTDQRPFALDDGDRLVLGAPETGMRTMLAVRGGFEAAGVLGSLSRDILSGLGPEPLAAGQLLPVRAPERQLPAVGLAEPWAAPAADEVVLSIDLGPRDDWFDDASLKLLTEQAWEVTSEADRVGIRLSGEKSLVRVSEGELPSEGVAIGSIQVPPAGQPMIFLADHPLTGGYPIIGVVRRRDLPLLAQARPGMRVRFATSDTSQATSQASQATSQTSPGTSHINEESS